MKMSKISEKSPEIAIKITVRPCRSVCAVNGVVGAIDGLQVPGDWFARVESDFLDYCAKGGVRSGL